MSCTDSVVLSDDFGKIKDSRFVLYGAGDAGISCFNYLKTLDLDDRILCFVDSDAQKHGMRHCGKVVRSIDFILQHPELVVIVSSGRYEGILRNIRGAGCANQVYAYVVFDPPYACDDEFVSDAARILKPYEPSDEYTKMIVDALLFARNPVNCKIQPIENVINLNMSISYWYDAYTSLNGYDALTICDAGAFDGDTLKQLFMDYGGRIKKYYAFEPDNQIFAKLIEAVLSLGAVKDNIYPQPFGIGEKTESLHFFTGGADTGHHIAEDGDVEVIVKRLDDLDIEVKGKLCIKMDIEGFEMEALKGAKGLIERYEPNLAICVYHKPNDVFLIPEYIKSINPGYNCIIRGGNHMVCYASCDAM
jgi:FkbM family methyltransferase